jgi:hypothetical protein
LIKEAKKLVSKKKTWDDFIRYISDCELVHIINENMFGVYVEIGYLQFYKSGKIRIKDIIGVVAKDRTFEQYITIIKNLFI